MTTNPLSITKPPPIPHLPSPISTPTLPPWTHPFSIPSLLTTSTPLLFTLGTGHSLLSTIHTLALTTTHELIFATCFWAPSPSLTLLTSLLLTLSAKAVATHTTIRIRISLSSVSPLQKLLHTADPAGHLYTSAEWVARLGLPAAGELPGLDVRVKSVFLWPFSVMHSKFVVVDRRVAVVPSCNVSWEEWFEGGVVLRGGIVERLVGYWTDTFGEEDDRGYRPSWIVDDNDNGIREALDDFTPASAPSLTTTSPAPPISITILSPQSTPIPTLLLSSPPTRSPSFRPLPCLAFPAPPSTPLNDFTLSLLTTALDSIYIQTPNLTSPPVLCALLSSLAHGVGVEIVTNPRLMWLEQLVTAGTSTPRCVRGLVRGYRRIAEEWKAEEGRVRPGRLRVWYYKSSGRWQEEDGGRVEPRQSHLKLTIVDGEWVLLGSGNMDRASWYTSQELGVACYDVGFAGRVKGDVGKALKGRLESVYDSEV